MTAATAPSIRTIHELKKYDGPLYIANNTPFKITCRDNIGDTRVDFELEAQGHPDSVMILPKGALDVRGIQKMWLNGEVTVSRAPVNVVCGAGAMRSRSACDHRLPSRPRRQRVAHRPQPSPQGRPVRPQAIPGSAHRHPQDARLST